MKKKTDATKLPLKAEQVRKLTKDQLSDVAGGLDGAGGSGPTHKAGGGI